MFYAHVGNCEESSPAMAEYVMFDAAVRHNDITVATPMPFFRFEHLMFVLAYGYSIQKPAWFRKAFPMRPTRGEREANSYYTFWYEALLQDGFLPDMDSRNHAINPFRLEKKSGLRIITSWCTTDGMTDRQTNRKKIKGRGTSSRLHIFR